MPKCDHFNAQFKIVIERWCDATIQISKIVETFDYDNVNITHNEPVSIKVRVNCPDCEFVNRYNAYSAHYCEQTNSLGLAAGSRWPTWLRNRLIPLRALSPTVQEACLACGVPPIHHPALANF